MIKHLHARLKPFIINSNLVLSKLGIKHDIQNLRNLMNSPSTHRIEADRFFFARWIDR